MAVLKRFWADESGTTAIQYAMIGTLISVAILGAVTGLSGNLGNVFNAVATAFTNAMGG
ncbi:pilus assembly protein Flp/PilA [Maritalea mobilis]|uniref:Pilus assembly protein Flp/PilA n=1 Tax=Maritalea mobilis TaxID=483324 RepID=A0A4R6VFF5_9HYPH|nr:Flp family type IVb pilin [Maritalea mobilis]TDQ61491.1 pilus assembly protein Flp/PilA [Maritalea mobilis]